MPSGRYLTAHVYCFDEYNDCFMSITVHALSEDGSVSQGLCGNYDGTDDNDLTQGGLPFPAYPLEPIQFSASFL